jgi:hypothetical protein
MAQIHWATATDGEFGQASDWAGGVVPGASDDAILDAAGSRFVVGSAVSASVESLQLAANATFRITGGTFTAQAGTGSGANWGAIEVGDHAQPGGRRPAGQ